MDIYAVIKNDEQEIVYVGQTKHLAVQRWHRHVALANSGKGSILHKSIRLYGRDAFSVIVLACVENKHELDAAEQFYIELYRPRYNMTTGGEHWRQVDPESESEKTRRQRLSESHSVPELVAKHRLAMQKLNESEDFRQASSDRARAMWTEEFRQQQARVWEKTREKRSTFYKDKYSTEFYKKKFSKINSEIAARPETKKKIRDKFYAAIDRDPALLTKMQNARPKKSVIGTFLATGEMKVFAGIRIASRELKIPTSSINKVIKGLMKSTHGWSFEENHEVALPACP